MRGKRLWRATLSGAWRSRGVAGQVAVALLLTAAAATVVRPELSPFRGAEAADDISVGVDVRRTATSRTVRNSDGSFTTTLFSGPAFYRDSASRWQPISSRLVPAQRIGFAWTNEANSFRASFRPTIAGEFFALDIEGSSVSLSLEGAAPSVGAVSGAGITYRDALTATDVRYELQPAGVKETLLLQSAQAPTHYRFVLKTDEQKLRFERRADGAWEARRIGGAAPLFVLAAPTMAEAASSAAAPVSAAGTSASTGTAPSGAAAETATSSGAAAGTGAAPTATTSTGAAADTTQPDTSSVPAASTGPTRTTTTTTPTATVEPASAASATSTAATEPSHATEQSATSSSATGSASTESPRPSAGSAATAGFPRRAPATAASLDVTTVAGGYALDLRIDAEWLAAPERRFPVEVDPTITVQPAVEDASFQTGCSTCATLDGQYNYIGADDSSPQRVWRSGIRFDLGDIPAGVDVTAAALKLYWGGYRVGGNLAHQLDVHRMTSSWISSSPPPGDPYYDATAVSSYTLAAGAAATWVSWPVTGLVNQWRSGTYSNFGFLLRHSPETTAAGGAHPSSSSYSDPTLGPKLEVTYTGDGVDLTVPETLHANGAELRWSRYSGPSGAAFQKYEVHRSATQRFTPDASTLLATIRDAALTFYRDTTAAPSATFYYKIVANTSPSNERSVTLPAAGLAKKTLQPAPDDGRATFITYDSASTFCGNQGDVTSLYVGTSAAQIHRVLLSFDLRDIPVGASITDAKFSLWANYTVPSLVVDTHNVRAEWREGSGHYDCTADGATWYDGFGGIKWTANGGDFDATAAASVTLPGVNTPGWYDFGVTSLVSAWANGDSPNLGMIVKLRDETLANGRRFTFSSDDETVAPTLRPKLVVTYADTAAVLAPAVSVSSPAPLAVVRGPAVPVRAAVADDRRVEQVEFLLDGTVYATDTSNPYEVTLDSSTSANGAHSLTVRATDDAGNVTVSTAVTVTVENSAAPTASIASVVEPSYQAAVLADGPVGYWRLGEATGASVAADTSGNGYAGTYRGSQAGVTGALSGSSDTAARFPATAENYDVNVGDVAAFDFGTGDFTAETWVKTSVNEERAIFGKSDGTSPNWRATVTDDAGWAGRVRVNIQDGTNSRQQYGPSVRIDDGVWHHVVVVFDRDFGTRIYVDGVGSANDGATPGSVSNSAPLQLGDTGGYLPLNGDLDEVALYAWALTAGRARAHYAAGRGLRRPGSYRERVVADNPAGYWRLGESVGATTAADASGNSRSGTYRSLALGVPGALVNGSDTAAANNGTDDHDVVVADQAALNFGSGDFTVEGWVRTTVNGERAFIGKGTTTSPYWRMTITDDAGYVGRVRAAVDDGTFHQYYGPPIRVDDGAWHHIVLVVDRDSAVYIYVDGHEGTTLGTTTGSVTNSTDLRVGDVAGYDALNGNIDEAAVYPLALSPARIEAHYDAGIPPHVRGTTTLVADAADDVAVSKVEFFVDGTLVATDSSTPYSTDWGSLAAPTYDGGHTVSVRAYDAGGQAVTASAALTTTNTLGNRYRAALTSSGLPQGVTVKATPPQEQQVVDVSVTNASETTWPGAATQLRYRWYSPDPAPVITDGPASSIGADLAPGASRTVRLTIAPPSVASGTAAGIYRLQLDLYDTTTSTWFSAKGQKPLEQPVAVRLESPTALGLERWHPYDGEQVGAGMQQLVNLANGNSLVRWTPFLAPGRGLSTVVDITYNSLEQRSESPIGNNFSLTLSGLTRLGLPLDVHPNASDTLAGRTAKWIGFVDGDGTLQRFAGATAGDGTTYYEEPLGVHLYLREYSTTDTTRKWALTRPDRVTFFYDADGYPTGAEDKNGNKLSFTLQTPPADETISAATKRITKVTDAAGVSDAAPNRSFDLSYYASADLVPAAVRGRAKRITDHTGSALEFDYYDDGNLRTITQVGGTKADGSYLADRRFVLVYTAPDGTDAAVAVGERSDPPRNASQSTRLFSIRDPRGKETVFGYVTSGANQWKLASRINRVGSTTSYAYAAGETTVTRALSRVSKYMFDATGRTTAITNAANSVTSIAWTPDNHVSRVTEPAGAYTKYAYNDNGQVTDTWQLIDRKLPGETDDLLSNTHLTYENVAAQNASGSSDTSGKWKTERTIPHISQLQTRTDPLGAATSSPTDDYQWSFEYDLKGNLTKVTEPEGSPTKFATTFAYNTNGTLASTTDANGRQTQFTNYDANGQLTRVVDAKTGVTTFAYDSDGLLRWVQDALHQSETGPEPREYRSYFDYDSFHRLGRQSTPKSTTIVRGMLIWSAADYDSNDNLVTTWPAYEGGAVATTPSSAKTTVAFDDADRAELVTGPPTAADPAGERMHYLYDAAGRITRITTPKGMLTSSSAQDFATFYSYDPLDRVTTQSAYEVGGGGAITKTVIVSYCYDLAGDLRSVTAPKGNDASAPVPFTACPAATLPYTSANASYTSKYEYDDAHRAVRTLDPLGNESLATYDLNGNVVKATDAGANGIRNETQRFYDQRNMLAKVVSPYDPTRTPSARELTAKYEYDGVGNIKRVISPRAWDASADKATFTQYLTSYTYDELNRLVRVDLPSATSPEHYLHRAYDAAGRLTMTSLPTVQASPGSLATMEKTTLEYFDTGWLRTSKDPSNPRVQFDYIATGQQASRIPEDASGKVDLPRQMRWTYTADGSLLAVADAGGQGTAYSYDANGNLTRAEDVSGLTSASEQALEVLASYDGFDELTKTRQRKLGSTNYATTRYTYDLNGALVERFDSGEETAPGAVITDGRRNTFSYDQAGRLATQLDYGADATGAADDQQISSRWWPNGWKRDSVIAASVSGSWVAKQTTMWTQYANGQLKTLNTVNGAVDANGNPAAGAALVERHVANYEQDGLYVGSRTKDEFAIAGPAAQTDCRSFTSLCAATYRYDARGRLVSEDDGHGLTSQLTVDPAGNVTAEVLNDNGAATTKTMSYMGVQLQSSTLGTSTQKYFYDPLGNVDCVTTLTGAASDCAVATGQTPSGNLLADYSYDYLNRLASFHSFTTNGTTPIPDSSAEYRYDALDRPVSETESHGPNGSPKTRFLGYLGLSTEVSDETHKNSAGVATQTKTYGYDPFGRKLSMTRTPTGGTVERYTFGYDAHGSVSLLLNQAGQATASYGYRAYGGKNAELTKGDDAADDPLNPYRYTGKRLDTGSSTLDMGARRFSPDTGRFLQQDMYSGGAANLGLATDALTGNRYAFAGGNPVGFVETDGHVFVDDEGGVEGPAPAEFIQDVAPPGEAYPVQIPEEAPSGGTPAQETQPAPAPAPAPAPVPAPTPPTPEPAQTPTPPPVAAPPTPAPPAPDGRLQFFCANCKTSTPQGGDIVSAAIKKELGEGSAPRIVGIELRRIVKKWKHAQEWFGRTLAPNVRSPEFQQWAAMINATILQGAAFRHFLTSAKRWMWGFYSNIENRAFVTFVERRDDGHFWFFDAWETGGNQFDKYRREHQQYIENE
jgi:RHS repeat-associated protein